MVEKVKIIRVSIDGLIEVVKSHLERWSDETGYSIKALNLGKMWLGKALGELGESNPYPESTNPQSDKIEPTADVAKEKVEFSDIDMSNQVAVAKKIRSEIKSMENDLSQMFAPNNTSTDLGTFVNQSRLALIEANMWIGMKLSDLREHKEQKDAFANNAGRYKYELYVEAIKSREAPGNRYAGWDDLSPMQKDAWIIVGVDCGNEEIGAQRNG